MLTIFAAFIPPQVTIIKDYAFNHNSMLKTVKCPAYSQLKCINDYAFFFSNIENLFFFLPSSFEQIDKRCFSNVLKLKKVVISSENNFFKVLDGKYVVKESNVGSGIFDV